MLLCLNKKTGRGRVRFLELGLDIPAVLREYIHFKHKVTPDFAKSDFCDFYGPSKLGSGAEWLGGG